MNSPDTMLPMPDAFAGTGDPYALAYIARVLSIRGKEWQLLAGNSTPSQTLRDGPIVLIGDHSNSTRKKHTYVAQVPRGLDAGQVNDLLADRAAIDIAPNDIELTATGIFTDRDRKTSSIAMNRCP